jgi:hypothetical protein
VPTTAGSIGPDVRQVDHFSADSDADAAWALPAMVGHATAVDRAARVDRMDAWDLFMLRS